jgi:hypothetical protein
LIRQHFWSVAVFRGFFNFSSRFSFSDNQSPPLKIRSCNLLVLPKVVVHKDLLKDQNVWRAKYCTLPILNFFFSLSGFSISKRL